MCDNEHLSLFKRRSGNDSSLFNNLLEHPPDHCASRQGNPQSRVSMRLNSLHHHFQIKAARYCRCRWCWDIDAADAAARPAPRQSPPPELPAPRRRTLNSQEGEYSIFGSRTTESFHNQQAKINGCKIKKSGGSCDSSNPKTNTSQPELNHQ